MTKTISTEISGTIEALRAEVRDLALRLARLESTSPVQQSASVAAIETAAILQPEEAISDPELLVISAAVAAFLGERAHVRQIRLLRSSAWGLQGRVSVQASHRLHNN